MIQENSYTNWQEEWKRSDVGASELTSQVFLQKLQKEEARSRRTNRGKMAALAAVLTLMAAQLAIHAHKGMAWQLPVGLGVIAVSSVTFFLMVRRHQFKIERLDLGLPALEFIRQALKQIPAEYDYIRRRLPVFIAWLALIGNLMLSGMWSADLLVLKTIKLHGVFTLFLILCAWGGFSIRKKRFQTHTRHLITDLEETLRSWSAEKT